LRKVNFDYGTSYSPTERQISIVLDKCFYQPTKIKQKNQHADITSSPSENNSDTNYSIFPLSGNGTKIIVSQERDFRRITWGSQKFRISNSEIKKILDQFFIGPNEWYLLSASMTDPDTNGFGYYVWKNFSSFTPRHASAIAAIMVKEEFLMSRGRKPIYLKKQIIK
jgi:hypothetical protein